MGVYIHEIRLEGESNFIKAFNSASELFQKSQDKSLSKEERDKFWKLHLEEKARIELGMY